jgi:methyl-accepting chemotaxis protein
LEAARAGEQGAAFAIVATETAKMAVQAVASSKKIRKMIGSISQNISGASSELKDRAASDIQATSLSRNEVNRTLDDMSSLHGEMQKTIEQSSDNSHRLAKDISSAVMAMQFQDAVSQRIEHVVHLLMDVHDSLKRQLGDNAPDSPPPEEMASIDWTSRMAKSYTMASEHQVLAEHRKSKAGSSSDLGNNVELF